MGALQKLSKSEQGFGGDLRFGMSSGLDGADTITSGLGEDVVFGGAGDDLIGWSVTNSVVLAGLGTLPEVSDGRDVVDGGTEDTLGDTFTVNGNTSGERFWIYTREAFVNRNPTAVLAVATEIVITRNGRAEADVIAEDRKSVV